MIGRKRHTVLDVLDQQIERVLRVRLDAFELRENALVTVQVIAVLDFIEPIISVSQNMLALESAD